MRPHGLHVVRNATAALAAVPSRGSRCSAFAPVYKESKVHANRNDGTAEGITCHNPMPFYARHIVHRRGKATDSSYGMSNS
jgi:hypothetical protein